MLNITALREAVQWAVDEHNTSMLLGRASLHNQESWALGRVDPAADVVRDRNLGQGYRAVSCTTGCCIAGHAALAAGDIFLVNPRDFSPEYPDEEYSVEDVLTTEGAVMRISVRARRLLGLDGGEGDRLFDGENDIEDIVRVATEIAESHGHTLGEFTLA